MNTNPNAKRILCYGDSNTWGDEPLTPNRYPADVRWTGVLQNFLGNDYEIIEEGLCGRTFVAVEEGKPYRQGITHLKSILKTHDPVDLVIVMLGTNDMKSTFNLSSDEITRHLKQTIDIIRGESIKNVLIICPFPVTEPKNIELDERMKRAVELSKELPVKFKEVAEVNDCLFLNPGEDFTLEDTDGYHLNAEHHTFLAKSIKDLI